MNIHLSNRFDGILSKAAQASVAVSADAQWYLKHWALPIHQLDDDQALMLSRSLEAELPMRPEAPRPDLPLAEGDLLPTIKVDQGAKSYHYSLSDAQGLAEWSSGTGKDMPMVSASAGDMIGYTDRTFLGYQWDTEDLRNSQFGGVPLVPTLSTAATRGHMEAWDQALAWGKESARLLGLFNHPNITITTAADNGGGSTFWRDKTLTQILADVGTLINVVPQVMNETRHVNTVLMSPRLKRYLMQTLAFPEVAGNSSKLWDEIVQTYTNDSENPIEFRTVRYLDASNARSDGQLASDALYAMIRNDPTKVARVNAMNPTFLAPQLEGLNVTVYGEAKRGGVEMAEPLTCVRMDAVFNG